MLAAPPPAQADFEQAARALLNAARAQEAAIRRRDWREVERLAQQLLVALLPLRRAVAAGVPDGGKPLLSELYEQNRRNALLLRHTLAHVRHVLTLLGGDAAAGYGPSVIPAPQVPGMAGRIDRRA